MIIWIFVWKSVEAVQLGRNSSTDTCVRIYQKPIHFFIVFLFLLETILMDRGAQSYQLVSHITSQITLYGAILTQPLANG